MTELAQAIRIASASFLVIVLCVVIVWAWKNAEWNTVAEVIMWIFLVALVGGFIAAIVWAWTTW